MRAPRCISESEYEGLEVDALLTLTSGQVFKLAAFPDGRPWARDVEGGKARPIPREEITSFRKPIRRLFLKRESLPRIPLKVQ